MSIFNEYLAKKAKKESPASFLMSIIKKCNTCHYATHNSKVADTNTPLITINDIVTREDKGYIHTANSEHETDVVYSGGGGNATIGALLMLRLEDGNTVLSHFLSDTDFIKNEVKELDLDYRELRAFIFDISTDNQLATSHQSIKQVYFPVDGTYHVLSILPSTSLMYRLNDLETGKFQRIKSHEAFQDFPHSILMKFGGSQTQNAASPRLSRTSGKCYLLDAIPPEIEHGKIITPNKNFFRSMRVTPFIRKQLEQLHDNIYTVKQNNYKIRDYRDKLYRNILDSILYRAARIQSLPAGWSDKESCQLPMHQRIWLDHKYDESPDNTWKETISRDIVSWMHESYNRVNHEYETDYFTFSPEFTQKIRGDVLMVLNKHF